MALTTRLLRDVPSDIRSRGRDYQSRGLVRIRHGDAFTVRASVRGTEPYQVELKREGTTVTASCTCPYYDDNLAICKHIWATLLAAERAGYLNGAGGDPRELIPKDDEFDDYGDKPYDEDDLYEDEPPGTHAPWSIYPQHSPPQRQGAARPAGWKQSLASLRDELNRQRQTGREEWPAGRELLYLVDVAQTLQGGRLYVALAQRMRKKDGEWSKPKVQSVPAEVIPSLPDAADRQILGLLTGAREAFNSYYGGYSYGSSSSGFRLSQEAQESLVPLMCRTGRCRLRLSAEDDALPTLAWDEGEPWELALEIRREGARKSYKLTGVLRRGSERRSLSEPALLVAGGLVIWEDRVARWRDYGAIAWASMLRQKGPLTFPAGQADAVLAELARLPRVPPLEVADELRFEEVKVTPRPRLKVKAPDTRSFYGNGRLTGELSFDYEGTVVGAKEPGRGVWQKEGRRLIVRDAEAERAAAERLKEVGFHETRMYGGERLELTPRHLPRVVRTLLDAGWFVEAEGKIYRTPGVFKIAVESGVDWFELHGDVKYGDTSASLPALLAAVRKGEDLVRLDDGTFGMLPEGWLKKYGLIAGLGEAEGDHIRFRRGQAGLLDALLAEQPDATWDEGFARTRDELMRFQGIAPVEAPPGFVGELRGYQREGLGWLQFLQKFGFGGCLADDMGLGKTVQVLALLAGRAAEKPGKASLVVVPKSLIFNWKEEAARFAPGLRVLEHVGVERRKTADRFDDYDVILTTYGTLRRDIPKLKDHAFDYCILDEAQAIKNATSESAKAVRLLKGEHRLALSGTPIENHLGELWSLFEFLNPGLLGSASVFRVGAGGRAADADSRALLAKALRPFILRRTKAQVARDLPEKLEQTLYVELEPEQRKLYDELRDHYRQSLLARVQREGINKSKIQVLEALLRLRQAACHPGLIDKDHADAASAKLDALVPQLTQVLEEGHKALVFSQFTSLLALLKKRLDAAGIAYEYLDGRTRNRAEKVEHFQNDPDCKLFLVSLKAGGLGLNLTAAEYVFLLDPWWNPAVESQAIDRAHRIGQTRRVFAYRLIARGTVEEKVLELQRTKRELADAVITADNALIRDLGREDLELLLS
jgi:hypothetical protein